MEFHANIEERGAADVAEDALEVGGQPRRGRGRRNMFLGRGRAVMGASRLRVPPARGRAALYPKRNGKFHLHDAIAASFASARFYGKQRQEEASCKSLSLNKL